MSPVGIPLTSTEPSGELSRQTRALLLLATSSALVGLLGWGLALALRDGAYSDDHFRTISASTLAAAVTGLLSGCWAGRCWYRDTRLHRTHAVKLNRFHAVMSGTNRLILRRPDPRELFEGVCDVCVGAGHMDLAVIDLSQAGEVYRATADTMKEVSTTASPQLLLDGALMQTLMMTLALRSGKPVVVDDAQTDTRLNEAQVWCIATGLCSIAAIPLRRASALVGILLLHSKTEAFFDGQVTPLLAELGDDLSFALDNADRERERHAAQLADQARTTAEDANRAKTEFLAKMSHELRTPLNAMLGFAQLLATDKAHVLAPEQAERVRLISHAGWHLLGLVNDVLDISRIESGHFEIINVDADISSVLDEAIALTRPLARTYRVELSERAASTLGIGAVVDLRRLTQVLLNLLSNACKYNRPGGHVWLDVTDGGTEVFLDVVDNGIGMTDEHLTHLFEPFNRLGHEGEAIEGCGIGLALSRQLVEMMHGRLDITSSLASGTRARVVLPACAIPRRIETNHSASSPTLRDVNRTAVVLYIEDDPVNQLLVQQILLRCDGVTLLRAGTGSDGIALARRRKPDLVLLDMHLPDMTGFDVLDALRADSRTEGLRVVAVSANAQPEDVETAMELGVLDYWTKPLKLVAFLGGVSMLLGIPVKAKAEHAAASANAGAY